MSTGASDIIKKRPTRKDYRSDECEYDFTDHESDMAKYELISSFTDYWKVPVKAKNLLGMTAYEKKKSHDEL